MRRLRIWLRKGLGLWTIDGVLESHGPCELLELSIVHIGLETAELRVERETQIDARERSQAPRRRAAPLEFWRAALGSVPTTVSTEFRSESRKSVSETESRGSRGYDRELERDARAVSRALPEHSRSLPNR